MDKLLICFPSQIKRGGEFLPAMTPFEIKATELERWKKLGAWEVSNGEVIIEKINLDEEKKKENKDEPKEVELTDKEKDEKELEAMDLDKLRKVAKELDIPTGNKKKETLIKDILTVKHSK